MEQRHQGEHRAISGSPEGIWSTADLVELFRELRIDPARPLMVHTALSGLGWIVGGAQAFVAALEQHMAGGLIAMPAHSNDLSDPGSWENPPVPEAWWQKIRDEMPPYDPEYSRCIRLGTVPEYFRGLEGTVRSGHPHFSLAARGEGASALCEAHRLNFPLGSDTPYHRLYEMNANILLYGVGFDNCTLLHLAEFFAEWKAKATVSFKAPMSREAGTTIWEEYMDIDGDSDFFVALGQAYLEGPGRRTSRTISKNGGTAMVLDARELVDFGIGWLEKNRT